MVPVISPAAARQEQDRIMREQERIDRERGGGDATAVDLDEQRADLADAALAVGRLIGVSDEEVVPVDAVYALVGMTREELLKVDIFTAE